MAEEKNRTAKQNICLRKDFFAVVNILQRGPTFFCREPVCYGDNLAGIEKKHALFFFFFFT